jgi:Tfp pilus assembly protein PilV
MTKFLKQKNKKISGFTLIETLVAISIFTMSVLAVMAVLANGISYTTYAKTKMTATYLAQEGIEYMRNLRDDYVLYTAYPGYTSLGWDAFLTEINICTHPHPSSGPNGCYFNDSNWDSSTSSAASLTGPLIEACGSPSATNNPCSLYYNPSTGVYGYSINPIVSPAVNSGFIREIKVTPSVGGNPDEIQVTSTVTWTQGVGGSVSFSEDLFNWTSTSAPSSGSGSSTL